MQTTTNLDRTAAAGSILCVIHCLALPVMAVSLPFLAAIADAEWVHWAFAVLAIVASLSVVATAPSARTPGFLVPAGLGIVLVGGALFAEGFGVEETIPTLIGGILLSAAHIRRLLSQS